MEQNVVNWFEIYVDDLNRARNFYETVLGKNLQEMQVPTGEESFEMLTFPWIDDAPNAAGALVKSEMGKPSSSGTIVYFACENCEVELSRVEVAGGRVLAPKFAIGEHGFCGLASDTEGNTIGFHSLN
jgi:predicted enzyme related to lactoylglutathione lyase